MKIEFDKFDFVACAAFKGGDGAFEVKTAGDKDNKIMYGRLRKGCSIGMHRHEGNAEIIRIALIIILTVLALVILGVYIFLLPREK